MNGFMQSVRFKILVALLTIMAGFIIMSVYTGGTAPLAAQLISFVTVPVQRTTARISGNIGIFFDRFINSSALYDENEDLKNEVNALRESVADYQTLKHENEQFREILGVMDNRKDLKVETAAVIARDPSERFYSFMIDKGTLNNVSVLDPVITADGLVGYVKEVGANYAKVITILDVVVNVGAYDSTTRDIGIVSGTIELASEGLCRMEYLPRDSNVAQGDIVLTSGGALYPRDIIIGKIKSVGANSHGTSLMAIIEPTASVQSIKNVFVVTEFEGQGQK